MTISWHQYRKYETILLGILLYGIILVYIYNYLQIAKTYRPWTTDEFFYYVEAKAISAYDIYQAPASLDGNTSFIGDFGFHGISYAVKDGWLAKLFLKPETPPLVWNNLITSLATLILILFFKPFSLNIRFKVALIVSTHYVLYSYTLSYMQETIHYLFAVLALMPLYIVFKSSSISKKHLYYYLGIVVLATSFRYGWFMWGAALLVLATNKKSFVKWFIIAVLLMAWGVFISRYIAAPYPYYDMTGDNVIRPGSFSLLNSITIAWQKFSGNLQLFLTPDSKITTTCMRYLLLILLLISLWYSVTKRNKFTIACTLIGWAYFMACMTFYAVYWSYDERALAVLNPLLAFSLVGCCNSIIFYPIMAVQLILFPGIVKETHERNAASIITNTSEPDRAAKEASFSKIKDMVNDDTSVVIGTHIGFVKHGTPDYFINLPLVNDKGHSLHYNIFRQGQDVRGIHEPKYLLNPIGSNIPAASELIYSDSWMNFYKITR